jgi:hypothetical protein
MGHGESRFLVGLDGDEGTFMEVDDETGGR